MAHRSDQDTSSSVEARAGATTPIYNPMQAARASSARRDFRIGAGLAVVLAIVFIAFPAGWTLHFIQTERANRRPERIFADLVSEFASTRKRASGRYSDVTRHDHARQIYEMLIEKTQEASDLSDTERAVLIDALSQAPSHYKFVDAKLQATLLGRELSSVQSVTQADLILDVLTSEDLITDAMTIQVICDFITDPSPQAFSYYGKSGLIWRLLFRVGLFSRPFEYNHQDLLHRKLDPELAKQLAAALTEYLEHSTSSGSGSKIIHRDVPASVKDSLQRGSNVDLSSGAISKLINKAIAALNNPLDFEIIYEFDLGVPDSDIPASEEEK